MSDSPNDFFAPPAFKPAEALVQLRRQLRELRPLTERSGSEPARFEISGQPALELRMAGDAIEARVAKRLARSPDWAQHTLKNSADVRKLLDEVKKRVANWAEDRD